MYDWSCGGGPPSWAPKLCVTDSDSFCLLPPSNRSDLSANHHAPIRGSKSSTRIPFGSSEGSSQLSRGTMGWLQNRFRGKPYEVLGRDIEISLHVSLFGLIFRQIKGENHEAPFERIQEGNSFILLKWRRCPGTEPKPYYSFPGSTVLQRCHTLFVFCVGGCVGGRGMNQHAAGRTLLFRKRPADFPRQW